MMERTRLLNTRLLPKLVITGYFVWFPDNTWRYEMREPIYLKVFLSRY